MQNVKLALIRVVNVPHASRILILIIFIIHAFAIKELTEITKIIFANLAIKNVTIVMAVLINAPYALKTQH